MNKEQNNKMEAMRNHQKKKIIGKEFYLSICMCLLLSGLLAQPKKTLNVGDNAPPMTIAKWMKGTPVPQLDKNKIYIVEFWATWCGPCKENMPHLSDISRKYAGKITVIGVDIWESSEGGKSFEDNLAFSQKFVDNMGKNMDYTVAADDKEGDMGKNWVNASGQSAIPQSFLIKDGKIVWEGHPHEIDPVITAVLAGTYAPDQSAESNNKQQISTQQVFNQIMAPAFLAFQRKDYDAALTASDSLITVYKKDNYGSSNQINGYIIGLAEMLKYKTLSVTDHAKGIDYLRELAKDSLNNGIVTSFALDLAKRDSLSKNDYQLAAELLLQKTSKDRMAIIYPYIAEAYYKMGDTKNAVLYQQQAITAGEEALINKQFVGDIRPDVIEDEKATLAKYQSGK